MKSHEAIQAAIAGKTIEHAKRLHKSTSLVNKWMEPSTDYTDSGTHNPLDRIETIIESAISLGTPIDKAFAPVHYLAQRFGLIVIPTPPASGAAGEVSHELMRTVKEFGDLAQQASQAMDDGRITPQEYDAIDREAWHLIQQTCSFLRVAKAAAR